MMVTCEYCGRRCSLNGYDKAVCENDTAADKCEKYRDVLVSRINMFVSGRTISELRQIWRKLIGVKE